MRIALKILGLSVLLLVLVLGGFRVAAALRETETGAMALPDRGYLVETRMGRVYIDDRGPVHGVPVLLIHGSVGWAGFWDETLDALATDGYRAIAMDLSPMGYSERDPSGDYGRKMQAARILALIDSLDISPVLLAHSFGAGPATEAVLDQPGVFRAMIIVAGAIGVGSGTDPRTMPAVLKPRWLRELAVSITITNPLALKPLLKMFLHRKQRALPKYLDVLNRPYRLQGSTAAIADWVPTLLETPLDAKSIQPESFRQLTLPTALIWGAEDTATPVAQGIELNRLIAESTLTVLPDLGHIPQIEDPLIFQEAVRTALVSLLRIE